MTPRPTQRLDELVTQIAPVHDSELGQHADTPAARQLMEQIMTEPVSSQRHRKIRPLAGRARRHLAVSVATVGVAVAAVIGVVVANPTNIGPMHLGPAPANAAVTFHKEDGYWVARVTDPHADSKRLSAAFAAHGLNIDLKLKPVSPGIVGQLIGGSATGKVEPKPLWDKDCANAVRQTCPIGLRIPVGYDGHATYTLGRKALPGEDYQATGKRTGPGETLRGLHLEGLTVKQLMPILRKHDVTAEFRVNVWTSNNGGVTWKAPADEISRNLRVQHVSPSAPGRVRVTVNGGPHANPPTQYHDEWETYGQRYDFQSPIRD